jgi:hypothetical protein
VAPKGNLKKGAGGHSVFRRAAVQFARGGTTIYFDLSPLRETNWTGIPVVAAGIARAMLETIPRHVRFFCGYEVIDSVAVADALRRNTGLFLDRDIDQGYAHAGKLPVFGEAGRTIGFFPSVKPLRGAFDVEISVVHDLSTLTLPLLHIRGNVVHHTEVLLADLASNDLTVTVSEATRGDVLSYLGADPARIVLRPTVLRGRTGMRRRRRTWRARRAPSRTSSFSAPVSLVRTSRKCLNYWNYFRRTWIHTGSFSRARWVGWKSSTPCPAHWSPSWKAAASSFLGLSMSRRNTLCCDMRKRLYILLFMKDLGCR